MKDRVVGRVSEREKNEVVLLTERLYALYELRLGKDNLNINEEQKNKLLDKIAEEEIKTSEVIQRWWKDKCDKYKWEQIDNGKWILDYKNCNVVLTEVGNC